MPLHLHLLRHAQTTAPAGTLVGSTEVALSAVGITQAKGVAQQIPNEIPCLCSPMMRARQTLHYLQKQGVACDVRFDDRLREIDFGAYEMKTFREISAIGVEMDAWREYVDLSFPGGESVAHFVERIKGILDELRLEQDGQILLLTHGGVIRTMICLALGITVKNYLLFDVKCAALSRIELYSKGGVLTALNSYRVQ